MMDAMIELEQIQAFMDMLTGESLPDGMIMARQPHLSRQEAFSVVWFLQEHLRVLPDHYEICHVCAELFDARRGGYSVDGTDNPDEWHQDIGVTKEMLKQHDGAMFCSEQCECKYWRKVQNEMPRRKA